MLTVHQTLDKLGLQQGVFLGGGCFANVSSIKNDPSKVIKVTGDPRDAVLAEAARKAQLQGKCKNLAHVHRVIECKANEWNDYSQYLCIVELLQPIPDAWISEVPYNTWSFDCRKLSVDEQDDMLAIAREAAKGNVDCRCSPWALAAMNLKGMADDLAYLGVEEWFDYKLENVMLRPGDRVVMSDFGCTKSSLPSDFERIAA